MHMLNIKRIALTACFLLMFFFTLIVSIVYFFDVNDHSDWVTKQLKQVTGYDVHFERVENNLWADKSLSITGLSLYQQQQRVLSVNQLDIQIESVDFWHRQLQIKSIKLNDVDVVFQHPISKDKQNVVTASDIKNKPLGVTELAWNKLGITQLEITHLNALVTVGSNSLLVKKGNVRLNDLLVIEQAKINQLPANLDFSAELETLQLKQQKQKVVFNHFNLSTTANLLSYQGDSKLSADKVTLQVKGQVDLPLQSLDLQLRLEQNKLSLQHFFVDAFSGSLALQAEAYFAFNLLPAPAIKLEKVDLLSIVAKNMQFTIPEFNIDSQKGTSVGKIPVGSVSITSANLDNISIYSEAKQLPLTLTSADVLIRDWQIIKEGKFVYPTAESKGEFLFAFKYLRWQDSIVEKFSMGSSQSNDLQSISLLRQLLIK